MGQKSFLKISKDQFEDCLLLAKDRLESAEILLTAGQYRDSISRSYYAFFDVVAALLATKGLIPKTHSGALQLFSLHFVKDGPFPKEYSKKMRDLLEDRTEADYDWKVEFTKEEAKEALSEAKEFIQVVKEKKEEIFKNQKFQKGLE